MNAKVREPISRREFLQQVALMGSAASIAALNASNLDSSPQVLGATGKSQQAWWVKEVDQPTVEIEWERVQRFDSRQSVLGGQLANYIGTDQYHHLRKLEQNQELERLIQEEPGYQLRDLALAEAQASVTISRNFMGPGQAKTPQERGVDNWSGSPEEAARLLRVAMRHFGAALVRFTPLDSHTRKLIYSHDRDGKVIEFEDIAVGYETATKRVIPEQAKWVIVYAVQMSLPTLKTAPTAIAQQTTILAYNRGTYIQTATQEFLRGLGYHGYGEASVNGLGISPALGVMAGLGELSRLNRLVTPEFGPMVRVFKMITDLPVAVDKPIDAGIMAYCRTCKKCAEACPPGALSFSEEPSWVTVGGWNNPGHKAYFEDSVKCQSYWMNGAGTNCGICLAVCPFSKSDKAWVHNLARATVAMTPSMNGVLRSLDDAFSYGAQKDPEEWWNLDLPEYGIDSDRTSKR